MRCPSATKPRLFGIFPAFAPPRKKNAEIFKKALDKAGAPC